MAHLMASLARRRRPMLTSSFSIRWRGGAAGRARTAGSWYAIELPKYYRLHTTDSRKPDGKYSILNRFVIRSHDKRGSSDWVLRDDISVAVAPRTWSGTWQDGSFGHP